MLSVPKIDDEPEPGPSCYFILTGFNSPELFKHFTIIKLKINALIHVKDCKEALPGTGEIVKQIP